MSVSPRSWRPLALLLGAGVALAGCSGEAGQMQMPAPEVTVVTLKSQPVPLTRELAGRTVPFVVAEVRPQATGIVRERLFDEGGLVKAGQVLYQLDDATYRAARDAAAANLARARASAESARLAAERSTELVKENLVSQQDHERTQAAAAEAAADVAAYRAALQSAEVNLGYTRISSPIDGRAGKSSVTQGALVNANQAQALVTVQQLDPMYVDLAQSASELMQLRKDIEAGRLEQDRIGATLLLEDGSAYPHAGVLEFTDVTVDPGTGSYALRVRVPNPDHLLLPGMYVRTVVELGTRPEGVLAPQQGISRDPKGNATALVVTAEGTVEARVVQVSRTIGDQWLVDAGLQAGDRMIIEGLQKVQPGAPARAVEAGEAPADANVAE
ncbi:efflux RND transporter periplasmic adaptor subunit [Arenimonas caeni]|jgi:membrane fusion protein (multidrug efflux system)|uniref:Efflux transporter periplasmic adaptor subunit n=1 Tax=Arenimonas caeni TaxID=2058085 RepID=A0A2P6M6Q8_9GAMM|nr:efflux RND transporter periplasmic adaptor subunit [Arenimonas caeni]MDY0021361.1 efflux RND transporter periplasmic adaptor subunit [Arenimonas caeni]PRH81687.1 efflux transporter periplasmic adaptor subunit [Arenimonas caeni]